MPYKSCQNLFQSMVIDEITMGYACGVVIYIDTTESFAAKLLIHFTLILAWILNMNNDDIFMRYYRDIYDG